MKRRLTIFTIAACVAGMLTASAALAQTPNIQVYFDNVYTQTARDCPGAAAFDTLYVVGNNFNMWIMAAEFMIDYSPSLVWLGDTPNDTPLALGSSPTGIAITWNLPRNGWGPVLMMQAQVLWQCTDCLVTDIPVSVLPYPSSGKVRAVRWPDVVAVDAVGMTSLICSTVPVERTTWGQIKSLFD